MRKTAIWPATSWRPGRWVSCLFLDHLGNCSCVVLPPASMQSYRIAVGPQQGRKVFTLQTLPACDERFDDGVGKVAGFSLHAGVAAKAQERKKLERLCRYISRPAVSEKRLSLTPNGNVRYQLKTSYRESLPASVASALGMARPMSSSNPSTSSPGWRPWHPKHSRCSRGGLCPSRDSTSPVSTRCLRRTANTARG